MPRMSLPHIRHAMFALCVSAAPGLALAAQPAPSPGPASTQPGSASQPDSTRTPGGDSVTRGQTDSNPDRPSASSGGRDPSPASKPDRAPRGAEPGAAQPMPRGQGTVEERRPDGTPEGQIPAGRAGSGGHKHGYGR